MQQLKPGKRSRKPGRARVRELVEYREMQSVPPDQYRSRIRSLYDGSAGAFLAMGSLLSLHEPLVGHVLRTRKFDVTRFGSILDVGSGAGQVLRHLMATARHDCRLVATDLSSGMLRRARTRIRSDRPVYLAADLTQLPFADASFDCVTCGFVLEHFTDPRPALAEIRRVLRPGGSLLLLATEDNLLGAVVSRTWECRTYSRQDLRAACVDVGLPWVEELWFTRFHRLFRMGGIMVEAQRSGN